MVIYIVGGHVMLVPIVFIFGPLLIVIKNKLLANFEILLGRPHALLQALIAALDAEYDAAGLGHVPVSHLRVVEYGLLVGLGESVFDGAEPPLILKRFGSISIAAPIRRVHTISR